MFFLTVVTTSGKGDFMNDACGCLFSNDVFHSFDGPSPYH